MKIFKCFITLAIISMTMSSCEESVVDADGNAGGPLSIQPPHYEIYLRSLNLRSYGEDVLDYNDSYQQSFYFYDASRNPIYPAGIIINNQATSYPNDDGVETPIDGTAFDWQIIGNQDIPTFSYTVTPVTAIELATPSPSSTTISKATGITINHGIFQNATNYYVVLEDNIFYSKMKLDSNLSPLTMETTRYFPIDNDGTTTITSAMLADFPTNRIIEIGIVGYAIADTTVDNMDVQIANGTGISIKYELQN